MTNLKFEELQLSNQLVRAVKDMGFEEATPIQSKAITKVLEGKDIIGQSQTGTGKTAAFGLPCIDMIDTENKKLQAVILSPTRELAIQICEEFRKFLKYKDDIKVLPVYGGQPIERQIGALKKGVQIVVGTPGRVMDHMKRRTLKMETVKMVILDEADEMLDMGFRDDIEAILDKIPEDRQTVLFSATIAKEIMELTDKYLVNPEIIKVARKELTVPNIEQIYFEIKEKTKVEATSRLIDMHFPELVVIFCNTKKRVDELVEHLQGRGYFAEGLHGDLKQIQRDIVMKKFRNRTIEILVATDVAARGIDVDDVDMVINYDLPQDEEYYVHRIGRTGRAGRSGKAFSFVVGREIYKLRDIMKYTKAKIKLGKLPSLMDIEEAKTNNFIEKIKGVIEEGRLTKYINIVENIINEDISAVDISAALLKMSLYDENTEDIDFEDDLEDNNEKLVRLFINVGKKKRVRAKDIVGAIAGECGIPGKAIGDIDIYDEYTFLDVPKKYVKDILKGMKGKKIKKVSVKVERAKSR
ncbi:DEAD/DEAH box helicase [[Clostridium] colinum]|uniref:DEAD/DEAH box helicase n=1 Tax=[Clostridium] colinum TaxID=36835 RepID=UPI00202445E6|nr:DEAD/DEAH box helicase [[Clostridium] colinum]